MKHIPLLLSRPPREMLDEAMKYAVERVR